jgi:hypothetical protein
MWLGDGGLRRPRAQTTARFLVRGTTPSDCWPASSALQMMSVVGPKRSLGEAPRCKRQCHNPLAKAAYSITSSARRRIEVGTSWPSALAVLSLMQDAEDDLHAEALKQLSSRQAAELAEVVDALAAPLHPNCYLSPTQFAEKFTAAARPRPRRRRNRWPLVLGIAALMVTAGLAVLPAHQIDIVDIVRRIGALLPR